MVDHRATGTIIEAALRVPLAEKSDKKEIGEQLATALAPYRQGRFQTLVGVDREHLQWQSLTLPPAPAEELPDLVRLQADRSMSLAEEKMGLDFLPLSGDEKTPHEVLAIGIDADRLAEIQHIASTAGVKVDRLVPLETGWLAIVRQVVARHHDNATTKNELHLYVALHSDRAILWAILDPQGSSDERVVLLRSLHMPALENHAVELNTIESKSDHDSDPNTPDASDELDSPIQALAGQLKRTLLALQTSHPHCPVAAVWLTGDVMQTDGPQAAEFHKLSQQLKLPVHTIDCHEAIPPQPEVLHPSALPLAGLALDAAQRRESLLDLVHPRRTTTSHANQRTHRLLATALACLLAWITWHGYQNIRLPKQAAEAANIEAALLQETADTYLADLQQAAAIGRWTAGRVDLLDQLERLSIDLRPRALDVEDFSASEDLVLMSLRLQKRQFDLNAVATNLNGVGALETRLRADHYLVQRDNTNLKSTLKNYDWPFRVIVQLPERTAAPQDNKEKKADKEDQQP